MKTWELFFPFHARLVLRTIVAITICVATTIFFYRNSRECFRRYKSRKRWESNISIRGPPLFVARLWANLVKRQQALSHYFTLRSTNPLAAYLRIRDSRPSSFSCLLDLHFPAAGTWVLFFSVNLALRKIQSVPKNPKKTSFPFLSRSLVLTPYLNTMILSGPWHEYLLPFVDKRTCNLEFHFFWC